MFPFCEIGMLDPFHVDSLVFLHLVEWKCFFYHETASAFASVPSIDVFNKNFVRGFRSSFWRVDIVCVFLFSVTAKDPFKLRNIHLRK